MDAEEERLARARAKNLAYIQEQDAREASHASRSSSTPQRSTLGIKGSKGNNSVYIMGLSTYMACRQLEGVCKKLGKVRRIKFYKDEKGGLKGDAVVTFHSHATMLKAVDREVEFCHACMLIRVSYLAPQLHHFEIKPGVVITAMEATFSSTKPIKDPSVAAEPTSTGPQFPVTESLLEMDAVAADSSALDLPSRSLILQHVWDPLAASDAAFFTELEVDMRSECSKQGTVEHVHIVADGSVIVRFTELKAAITCLKVLNGRWFAGRQIKARFDPTTAENPSDADTKVEAFLAALGE